MLLYLSEDQNTFKNQLMLLENGFVFLVDII